MVLAAAKERTHSFLLEQCVVSEERVALAMGKKELTYEEVIVMLRNDLGLIVTPSDPVS